MSGPLPAICTPITIPASSVYRAVIAARNRYYDRSEKLARFEQPVLSVGNMTTGGTGKSPVVAWIVDQLKQRGHSPVIVMRGYGSTKDLMSDEALEYHERLPDVPVLARPDRVDALSEFLPKHPDVDCIVLDDGFQHRRIARDLDLVLVDASRATIYDHLLPWGHLREPLTSLKRADAVIVTRSNGVDASISDAIARYHGRPPIAWTQHRWQGLRIIDADGSESREPTKWLEGRIALTMFGTGNPQSIIDDVERAGAIVRTNIPVRDHQRYTHEQLRDAVHLARGLDAMIVTGKDWVKIRPLLSQIELPCPIVVPDLTMHFVAGEDALRALISARVEADSTDSTDRSRLHAADSVH